MPVRALKLAGFIKGAMLVALIAAYALATHFALTFPNGRAVAAALAIGVPALALVVFIFQFIARLLSTRWHFQRLPVVKSAIAAAAALLPLAGLLWAVWPIVLNNAQALYFVQHVGTNALLAWVFGHTLAAGSTPLVVTFARMVHPDLPPDIMAYARKVTAAWTLFFFFTCVISAVLFFTAPVAAWSVFAVLLQWPSVGVFFVAEYLLRRRLFRNFRHASLKQGIDAYKQHQAGTAPVATVKIDCA